MAPSPFCPRFRLLLAPPLGAEAGSLFRLLRGTKDRCVNAALLFFDVERDSPHIIGAYDDDSVFFFFFFSPSSG